MASRRASGTGRRHPAVAELDVASETQGGESAGVQVVEEPGGTHAAFWPTRVYARIERRSQRVSVRRWIALLFVLDFLVAILSVGLGTLIIFGGAARELSERLPYLALEATFPVLWVAAMLLSGSYDRRYLAAGPEQYRRVCNASIWILALIGFTSYVLRADFSRGLVLITIPTAALLTLMARWFARKALRSRFGDGVAIHRIVEVGPGKGAEQLRTYIDRNTHTGFAVVGIVATDELLEGAPIDVDGIVAEVRRLDADTIAFVGTTHSTGGELRRMSWALQGSGIRLLVVPDLADIAGPRIVMHPVDGLPLLEVCEPELTGPARVLKSVFDRCASLFLIVILSPVLVAIAIAIKLSDGGPVFFRQRRIGKEGHAFRIWKFRSMRAGVRPVMQSVDTVAGEAQVLAKTPSDERVTSVGRFLRRYSLDELPQLFNVLTGSMSLVGPRPLVPDEVDSFGHGAQARLLVTPGMTGLWQVRGRSELPWDERVHLDLYYVENWSIWLDISLLWSTLRAIAHSDGAY
jgi:exopolysaccharide biosynthesis polyprenyl glycosylphosphotransferase